MIILERKRSADARKVVSLHPNFYSMKKTFSIVCVFFLLVLAQFNSHAANKNVPFQTARSVAAYYFSAMNGKESFLDEDVDLVQAFHNPQSGEATLYVFNVGGKGFVIVSGCTAANPIVAYSAERTIDREAIAPSARYWLEGYSKMVAEAQNEGVEPTPAVEAAWKAVEGQTLGAATKSDVVLMTEKWGQGPSHNPTYNLYSPVLWGRSCPTGCGPTAMGQIMHYWHYPKVGKGQKNYAEKYTDNEGNVRTRNSVSIRFNQTFYDYDLMPDVSLTSSSDSASIKATALLLFHAGVAVGASYGVDGTGAIPDDVSQAFYRNFKYKTCFVYHRGQFSDEDWMSSLRQEIDHHRPVFYAGWEQSERGNPEGGHAFICHGYQTESPNMFAMNWGWTGSCDGWYDMSTVQGLDPSAYVFSYDQLCILGLEPPDDSNAFVGIRQVEPSAVEAFPAYPNPAYDRVTIPCVAPEGGNAALCVYDMSGRLVEKVSLAAGRQDVTVNVSSYRKGVYAYRVGDGPVRKFVVQ